MRSVPLKPGETSRGLDPAASLRAAAARFPSPDLPWKLQPEDLRRRVRLQPCRRTVLFVVDASDSMGGGSTARMAAAKGAVLGLLQSVDRHRDRVALVSFRDRSAKLILPPTGSLELASRRLSRLAVGGSTPLAAGLARAWETARAIRAREPEGELLVILLTDGEANVPLVPGSRIGPELKRLGKRFQRDGIRSVLVHCGDACRGDASASRILAGSMGAEFRLLERIRAADLRKVIENRGEPEP